MFEGFDQVKDEQARKRWFASTGTSLLICAVIGVGILVLSRQVVQRASAEDALDVTFQASPDPEPVKHEAPPPPPPPAPKIKRPGRVAPAQPTAIPTAAPEEANPGGGNGTAAEPEEFGDGNDPPAPPPPLPPPPPPPPPPTVKDPDPIFENDPGVTPAKAVGDNILPIYPEVARKKGMEAEVILKIHISAAGAVISVVVVRGEEPFASAAVTAAKTWHYRPALVDGRPTEVARLVKIPFRIH